MFRPPDKTCKTPVTSWRDIGWYPYHQSHDENDDDAEHNVPPLLDCVVLVVKGSEGGLKAEDENGEGHYP